MKIKGQTQTYTAVIQPIDRKGVVDIDFMDEDGKLYASIGIGSSDMKNSAKQPQRIADRFPEEDQPAILKVAAELVRTAAEKLAPPKSKK